MKFRASLRFRVTAGFAALGAVLSLLLGMGIYVASADMEKRLVDETLTAELDDYIARRARNPESPPPATKLIHGYIQALNSAPSVPPVLAGLAPGRHRIERDGTSYRVAVAERDGNRFYLLYNENIVKRRHQYALMLVAIGVAMTTVLAAALGRWLANRVVSPVTQLAGRVMKLRPEEFPAPLAADYPADEVGELAMAFDRYMQRIRGFVEREQAFTADLSHELRTPLTVINGAAEVLLADERLSANVRNRVGRIQRASEEMAELVPVLLALAREDEQGPSAPRARLRDVVNQVLDTHMQLLDGKEVEVQLEIAAEPELQVEPALLRTVVGNLIRNAFIYTEQGRIRLQLGPEELVIEDTGVGIPTDEIEQVFQRYYVAGTGTGSGIGLSLVKRICERYGWNISLRSTPQIGTVIRMRFAPSALA